MKGSERAIVYFGTFIFVIVGYIVYQILNRELTNLLATATIPPPFTLNSVLSLVYAITWWILCVVVYFGSTRWLEEGEKVGLISLFFLILWIIAGVGMLIGGIVDLIIRGSTVSFDLDILVFSFIYGLGQALAPAIAAVLGVSNKARGK
ncbi:MAG: hypothetical protein ACFFE8_03060 [Candidatus Heimdallarchaeota archaeon]